MNEVEISAGLPVTAQYHYAQLVHQQLFVAGQLPHDSQGRLVGQDDPYNQAIQCLKNLNTLIEVHGCSTSEIRQLVVYVVGEPINLSMAWNAVVDFFKQQVPPATLLGVARLGYAGQLVEITATVVKA